MTARKSRSQSAGNEEKSSSGDVPLSVSASSGNLGWSVDVEDAGPSRAGKVVYYILATTIFAVGAAFMVTTLRSAPQRPNGTMSIQTVRRYTIVLHEYPATEQGREHARATLSHLRENRRFAQQVGTHDLFVANDGRAVCLGRFADSESAQVRDVLENVQKFELSNMPVFKRAFVRVVPD
jgi:hypothetical protein